MIDVSNEKRLIAAQHWLSRLMFVCCANAFSSPPKSQLFPIYIAVVLVSLAQKIWGISFISKEVSMLCMYILKHMRSCLIGPWKSVQRPPSSWWLPRWPWDNRGGRSCIASSRPRTNKGYVSVSCCISHFTSITHVFPNIDTKKRNVGYSVKIINVYPISVFCLLYITCFSTYKAKDPG